MSWQAVQWVLHANRSARGSALTVLIVIAEAARPDGTGCTLSVRTIAERARTTERNVTRSISGYKDKDKYIPGLIDIGVLKVEYNVGRRGTNVYSVLMQDEISPAGKLLHFTRNPRQGVTPDNVSPQPDPPTVALFGGDSVSGDTLSGVTTGAAGGDTLSPEPSLNHLNNSPSVDGSVRSAQKARGTAADRGTRISRDFKPDAASVERIRALGFTNAELRHHTAQFIDYWDAESGSKAVKKKWNSAWCVWMRKETPGRWPGNPQNRPGTTRTGNGVRPDRAAVGLELANELISRGL